MVEIPENAVTQADLAEWYKLTEQLSDLKAKETVLRSRIYKYFFTNPVEGTNTYVLPDKYQLKAVRKVERKVDEAALQVFRQPQEGKNTSKFEEVEVNAGTLFKTKFELVVSEYRKLSDDQKKVVDQVLIIKDGSPQLDITPPSSRTPKNVV